MEKKTNKGLIGFVIVLVLLVLGMGGYIFYDKVLSKDKVIAKKEEKKQEENLSTEEKKTLEEKMQVIMQMDDSYDTPNRGLYYKKNSLAVADMSSKERLFLALKSIEPSVDELPMDPVEDGKKPYVLSEDKVKQAYKEMFGEDSSYKAESVVERTNGVAHEYNKENKTYEIYAQGVGGAFGLEYHYTIDHYEAYNTEVKVYVKSGLLLMAGMDETVQYEDTGSDEDTYNLYQPSKDINDTDSSFLVAKQIKLEEFDSYKDKLDTYVFTFKKTDGKFYFTKVEKEQ